VEKFAVSTSTSRWLMKLFFANSVDDDGKVELFGGANFRGNDAEDHADVAALLEDVDAEAAEAGHAVSHVEFGGFLKLLLLPVGHHAECHGEHFFRRDAGDVGERREEAVDAQVGVVTDFEMQVGGFVFYGAA
jgi:Asp-tRNA(Asn)/Glu-tRNA(Gln) amidotransferase A subunit family amidase